VDRLSIWSVSVFTTSACRLAVQSPCGTRRKPAHRRWYCARDLDAWINPGNRLWQKQRRPMAAGLTSSP